MMTPQIRSGQALEAIVKEARPELKVVAGGAHLDATREDALEECRSFDYGIQGEGEDQGWRGALGAELFRVRDSGIPPTLAVADAEGSMTS